MDNSNENEKYTRNRFRKHVLPELEKEDKNVYLKSFQEIKKLLTKNSNKKISLSDNFIARRSYNYLIIEKNKNIEDYEYVLNDEVNILNKYNIKIVKKSNDTSNNVIRLNSKEISLPLKIRNVKDGDKIKVKNLQGG